MDVPSVLVIWSDNGNPDLRLAHRFYPVSSWSMEKAHDHLLSWYQDRRCEIHSMEWAWGMEPRLMPKSRLVPCPLPAGLRDRAV